MPEHPRTKEPLAAVLQDELQRAQTRVDELQQPVSPVAAAEAQRDLEDKEDALRLGKRAVKRS